MKAVQCPCGADGEHPAGRDLLCPQCFDRLFGDARVRYVIELGGVGFWRQDGCLRPDYGPMWAECRCGVCNATAVAVVGSDCSYCEVWLTEAIDRQELEQRRRMRSAA